jgi:hypothetical protein
MRGCVLMMAAIFLVVGGASSAIERQNPSMGTTAPKRTTKAIAITGDKCTSGGGMVLGDDKCKGGYACIVRSGERICISSAR